MRARSPASKPFPDPTSPLGQKIPRETAQLFMPGIISTYGRNGNIAFLDDGEFCVFTTDETGTRFTYLQDGHWTMPQQVPWGYKQGINDYTLGGDGKTFYWQSGKLTDENDTAKDTYVNISSKKIKQMMPRPFTPLCWKRLTHFGSNTATRLSFQITVIWRGP